MLLEVVGKRKMYCSCQHRSLAPALLRATSLQTQISTAQSRHATFFWPSCAHLHRYTCCSSKADGQHQSMDMLLVRYYDACPIEDYDRDVDLSLQHLVWEEGCAKTGRKIKRQPRYAVVDCSSVIRQSACVHISRSGMKVKGITFWSTTC